MKRYFSVLLLIIYTFSGIGLQINTHLCAGEISSVKVQTSHNTKSDCGCETEEKKDECCQNQLKNIKLENEQKKNETNNILIEKNDVQVSEVNYCAKIISSKTNSLVNEKFPPLIKSSPQDLFCIYLI